VAPCLQRLSSPGRGPRVCHLRREIAAINRATGSTALIRSLASFSASSQDRRRRDFDTVVSFWPAPQRAGSRRVPVRPDPARAPIGPDLLSHWIPCCRTARPDLTGRARSRRGARNSPLISIPRCWLSRFRYHRT